ncbi:MAG: sigma 54-interacting transcriptional regulator [Verrucomicrobia bacterium]|nr:sigma 54-interacting transcriptional regulator [Verrucomicrobiota bacterium]
MKTLSTKRQSAERSTCRRTFLRRLTHGAVPGTHARPPFRRGAPFDALLRASPRDAWRARAPRVEPQPAARPRHRPDFDVVLQVGRRGLRCAHTSLGVASRPRLRGGAGDGRFFGADWEDQGFLGQTHLKLWARFEAGGSIRLKGRSSHPQRRTVVRFHTRDDRLLGVEEVVVGRSVDRVWVSVCDADGPDMNRLRCLVSIEWVLPRPSEASSVAPPVLPSLAKLAHEAWDKFRSGKTNWIERAGLVCAPGSPIETLADQVSDYVDSDCPMLILGATGSGKSRLAEWVHRKSRRCGKAFFRYNAGDLTTGQNLTTLVKLLGFGRNCGFINIPASGQDGVLKLADGGTVFFDELEALCKEAQTALLLVLDGMPFYPAAGEAEEIRSDVRFIFAMNRDLDETIEQRVFRDDFVQRVKMLQVHLPPLRERRADIAALIAYFTRTARPEFAIEEDLFKAMMVHSWSANVRELMRFVEALLSCKSLTRVGLAQLEKTIINPALVRDLKAAYAQYQAAHKACSLAWREKKIVAGFAREAADAFLQAFGPERCNSAWDWRGLVGQRVARCRDFLMRKTDLAEAQWSVADNLYDLLIDAYGKPRAEADKLVRRILAQVRLRLKRKDVAMSSKREQNRYETFRALMGLEHHNAAYTGKTARPPPG